MGESLISFNKNKLDNFSGDIRQNEAFQGVYFLRIRGKNLVKSRARNLRSQKGVVLFVRERRLLSSNLTVTSPSLQAPNITRQKCCKRRKLWVRCYDEQNHRGFVQTSLPKVSLSEAKCSSSFSHSSVFVARVASNWFCRVCLISSLYLETWLTSWLNFSAVLACSVVSLSTSACKSWICCCFSSISPADNSNTSWKCKR